MPEMNGIEAASLIRKDKQLKGVSILVISASAMKNDEMKISKLCNGYITKPLNKLEFFTEIMKFLPYTLKEELREQKKIVIKDELCPNSIRKFPELLKMFKTKQNLIKELSTKLSIDEIENFADEIKKLGVKFNYQPLTDYAEKLVAVAFEFDSERLRDILLKLYNIIEEC